jgi:hypothetical protein
VVVLLKLDVDGSIMLHIHQMERSSALPDHLQIGLVGGIVEPTQLAIIDAEAILPDVQRTLLGFRGG